MFKREFSPLEREHIFLIQGWRNEQMDVLRQKKKLTRAGQIRWFESLKMDKNQKLFAIYETCDADKKFIGYCGLVHMDHVNRRAETSFLVATPRTKDWALRNLVPRRVAPSLTGCRSSYFGQLIGQILHTLWQHQRELNGIQLASLTVGYNECVGDIFVTGPYSVCQNTPGCGQRF